MVDLFYLRWLLPVLRWFDCTAFSLSSRHPRIAFSNRFCILFYQARDVHSFFCSSPRRELHVGLHVVILVKTEEINKCCFCDDPIVVDSRSNPTEEPCRYGRQRKESEKDRWLEMSCAVCIACIDCGLHQCSRQLPFALKHYENLK